MSLIESRALKWAAREDVAFTGNVEFPVFVELLESAIDVVLSVEGVSSASIHIGFTTPVSGLYANVWLLPSSPMAAAKHSSIFSGAGALGFVSYVAQKGVMEALSGLKTGT